MIPTTRPFLDSSDLRILKNVISSKILVDGIYQEKVEKIIKKKINSRFIAVTQSCTDALEISAILLNLKKDDEVIMPSYNFVSMANAIFLRGAKPVFVDVDSDTLNIKVDEIEKAITKRTKAIYLVHYGSNFCDMKKFIELKKKYNILIVEDAAHSIFGLLNNKYVGTIGDIGTFSFHETKNFSSGQGGAISINNKTCELL
jgi:dTDP-4-amino-4,6-dideoxygalactose transaminase